MNTGGWFDMNDSHVSAIPTSRLARQYGGQVRAARALRRSACSLPRTASLPPRVQGHDENACMLVYRLRSQEEPAAGEELLSPTLSAEDVIQVGSAQWRAKASTRQPLRRHACDLHAQPFWKDDVAERNKVLAEERAEHEIKTNAVNIVVYLEDAFTAVDNGECSEHVV